MSAFFFGDASWSGVLVDYDSEVMGREEEDVRCCDREEGENGKRSE